ncbi:MAG: D-alanine--D-alanine ligase, partial [Spirochaetia bacterium]|nr:D-alanine--D-alanine ligase [Spirochaetia bacterium]
RSCHYITPGRKEFRFLDAQENRRLVPDVAFPVLHGPFGEDGSIQGIFRHIGLPFVGADVLGSAVGMDKDIMKQILIKARIPTAKYFALRKYENPDSDLYIKELGMPIFVKPANMGSSIGVNRAETKEDLLKAIKQAFQYDSKIIIEESIDGREIECSVMGNHHAEASSPGEIVLHSKFYSYDEKYDSSSEAELIIPADLKPETARAIKETAVKTFRELQCSGFARVDFFVKDEQIYVNEINTLPGFTAISMYPKLWEYDGISTPELLDHLIQYAFEKYDNENALKKTI